MLTQDIFKETTFYGLMAMNKNMLDVSRGHDDGNHIGAINSIKMFFMAILMTRATVWTYEPQGVDERLDPWCGEF